MRYLTWLLFSNYTISEILTYLWFDLTMKNLFMRIYHSFDPKIEIDLISRKEAAMLFLEEEIQIIWRPVVVERKA